MASYFLDKTYFGPMVVEVDELLQKHPSAKCGVIFAKCGSIILHSHGRKVAIIDPNGWLSICNPTQIHSPVHIKYFLEEYAPKISYQEAKCIMGKWWSINIHTRELRNIGW